MRTEVFSSARVSYGGVPSEEVKAFQVILDAPYAESSFKALVREGSLAGKLYGLCGLYLVDMAAFEQAVLPFLTASEPVSTQLECSDNQMPVMDIVWSPERRATAIPEKRSLSDALQRAETMHGDGYERRRDIVGGEFPYEFGYTDLGVVRTKRVSVSLQGE